MTPLADEMSAAAETAIEQMRSAAIEARALHARSELLRHMLLTARKVSQLPREEGVATITREWMKAWGLGEEGYPELGNEMRSFTDAVCDVAETGTAEADRRLRTSLEALDLALAEMGMTLADQMAWRSVCAHGWWAQVVPRPDGMAGPPARPAAPGQPFWDAGCAPHCLGDDNST